MTIIGRKTLICCNLAIADTLSATFHSGPPNPHSSSDLAVHCSHVGLTGPPGYPSNEFLASGFHPGNLRQSRAAYNAFGYINRGDCISNVQSD